MIPAARSHRDQLAFSCDTLVARPQTGPPRTIFGKNSDRHWSEAQPLEFVPAATHPPGSYVRCQYLTIPQVSRTLGVLGSRPWWLWGFEHGVNEAGVAIGNEAIYTRDAPLENGLLGMDLVRLGLERGNTASAATAAIIELLERHGQGGNAVLANGFEARYHNSFIIADAHEVYVLETSARHWVHRRTTKSAAIANLITIEDDWTDASDGIETYAREQGWWWGPQGRKLNFRLAFEDATIREITEDRYRASCRFLKTGSQSVSVPALIRHLRDHFDSGIVHTPETPEAPRPRSICCHPGRFASATAASMVVELTPDLEAPIAWCSMSTPCTSPFLPIPVGAELPPALVAGGDIEDGHSLWWAMRTISEIVDHNPTRLAPLVQATWLPWESALVDATGADPASASSQLSSRVQHVFDQRFDLVERLAEPAMAGQSSGPK